MAMAVTQVRLPEGLIKEVDKLVDKGIYINKSDVVRDALRKLVLMLFGQTSLTLQFGKHLKRIFPKQS